MTKTPQEMRREMLAEISTAEDFDFFEDKSTKKHLVFYGILDALKGRKEIFHQELVPQFPIGLREALEVLINSEIFSETRQGYENAPDFVRLKNSKYSLTQEGELFRREYLAKLSRIFI